MKNFSFLCFIGMAFLGLLCCKDIGKDDIVSIKDGFTFYRDGRLRGISYTFKNDNEELKEVSFMSEHVLRFGEEGSILILETLDNQIDKKNYWIIQKNKILNCNVEGYDKCLLSVRASMTGPLDNEAFNAKCDSIGISPTILIEGDCDNCLGVNSLPKGN